MKIISPNILSLNSEAAELNKKNLKRFAVVARAELVRELCNVNRVNLELVNRYKKQYGAVTLAQV
jgi:hypothetical protein